MTFTIGDKAVWIHIDAVTTTVAQGVDARKDINPWTGEEIVVDGTPTANERFGTNRQVNELVVIRGGRLWPRDAPRDKQRWYYLVQLQNGETANAWEDELHRIAGIQQPGGGGLIR